MKNTKATFIFFPIISIILFSCSSPRSMLNSGKVLTKNQVRFGQNYTFNISSAPISESVKGSKQLINDLSKKDTIYYDKQIEHLNTSLIAYSIDPIGYNNELFFRYGLGHRIDLGYKNVGSANAFDVMYQFLGSNESFNYSEKGGMYGSIGVQYSWNNYRFANYPFIDKINKFVGYELSRKDILIPIVFSKSFGPEERTGCLSFGVNYSHSFIKYKIVPKNIYSLADNNSIGAQLLEPVNGKNNFGAFGTFVNVKIGKKYVFFNLSLAAYYQNYGSYKLINGGKATIKGISIVPSYGIQFNIYPKTKKKPETTTL